MGYDSYQENRKKQINQASSYSTVLRNYGSQHKLGMSAAKTKFVSDLEITHKNKVLWTEKFIALGSNIDNSLWLTNVYLENKKRKLGGIEIETPVMIIEGKAWPSTKGHIARIAHFIQRLEGDQDNFMRDFRQVKFNGAELVIDGEYQVINFQLNAWYDRNKRLESQNTEVEDEEDSSLLGNLNQKTRKHNQDIEQAMKADLQGTGR